MIRACAWCKCDLGIKPGKPETDCKTTHGMCPDCFASYWQQIHGTDLAVNARTIVAANLTADSMVDALDALLKRQPVEKCRESLRIVLGVLLEALEETRELRRKLEEVAA